MKNILTYQHAVSLGHALKREIALFLGQRK